MTGRSAPKEQGTVDDSGGSTERVATVLGRVSRVFFVALFILGIVLLVYRGVSPLPFNIFGIVAYGMALAVGACALVPRGPRINLALVVFVTLFSLAAANVFLATRANSDWARLFQAKLAGIDFDMRSRFDVVQDFRAKGIQAVPVVSQQQPEDGGIYPVGAIANAFTVFCNELGFFATYRSDRYGFNNPDAVYDQPRHAGRAVVVGDSFAHGACVREGEDVASVLRRSGRQALNLAISGNGPLSALASYVEYGRAYKPDHVLWMYYEGNDLENLTGEMKSLLSKYLGAGFTQNLRDRTDAIAKYLEARLRVAEEAHRHETGETARTMFFHQLLTLYHIRRLIGFTRDPSYLDEFRANLRVLGQVATRFKDEAKADGVRLVFVYLPSFESVARGGKRFNPPQTQVDFKQDVLSVIKSKGIEIADFEPVVLALPEPLSVYPLGTFGHFNDTGYALLANWVSKELAAK